MNDTDYVEQYRRGDSDGFGYLYELYSQKIYSYLYYRTHHKDTAEDLTSITFTKALERIDRFDTSLGTFSSWIYTIARNTLIDHYRTSVKEDDIESVWDLADNTDIERDIDVSVKIKKVEAFLKKLTKEQREIVIMRVWDGMSFKEIAEITNKSEASCKMSFYRTLQKLQSESISTFLILLTLYHG